MVGSGGPGATAATPTPHFCPEADPRLFPAATLPGLLADKKGTLRPGIQKRPVPVPTRQWDASSGPCAPPTCEVLAHLGLSFSTQRGRGQRSVSGTRETGPGRACAGRLHAARRCPSPHPGAHARVRRGWAESVPRVPRGGLALTPAARSTASWLSPSLPSSVPPRDLCSKSGSKQAPTQLSRTQKATTCGEFQRIPGASSRASRSPTT